MAIHVGCSGMSIKRGRYFKSLAAVEVLPPQEVPPKPSSVRRWVKEAPDNFCFTMVASRFISTTPERLPPGLDGSVRGYGGFQLTPEVLGLYERTVESAVALGAKMLVFVTTPQVSPSRRGHEALRRFFEKVDRQGLRFAWEPHGPWENAEVEALCRGLDLVRCVDPLRDPIPDGADAAYARLGPFAVMGRAMADDELETILELLEPFDEAFCFFNTERAFKDAQRLRAMSES